MCAVQIIAGDWTGDFAPAEVNVVCVANGVQADEHDVAGFMQIRELADVFLVQVGEFAYKVAQRDIAGFVFV
jgi:hypothetical protein